MIMKGDSKIKPRNREQHPRVPSSRLPRGRGVATVWGKLLAAGSLDVFLNEANFSLPCSFGWFLIKVNVSRVRTPTCNKAHDAVALSLDHLEQLPDEGGHGSSGNQLYARCVGAGVGIVVLVAVQSQRHTPAAAGCCYCSYAGRRKTRGNFNNFLSSSLAVASSFPPENTREGVSCCA